MSNLSAVRLIAFGGIADYASAIASIVNEEMGKPVLRSILSIRRLRL
jgi:hypothetical protein